MAIGDPYLSLDEFKARIEIFDTDDDTRILSALASASTEVNEYCKRQFNDGGTPTSIRYFTAESPQRCTIDDVSTATGLVVKVGSKTGGFTTTWVLDTDFELGPESLTIDEVPYSTRWQLNCLGSQYFPRAWRGGPNVQVTARWGWASVPANVVEATYLRAAQILRRRDAPEGVLGGFDGNAVRVSIYNDPDVIRLLKPFRKHLPGMF